MATAVDPLRSTLDHLALDPRARSDRPYLITMLRRLGYSEAEIAAYLGEPEPQPEPPALPQTPPPAPEPARAPAPEPVEEPPSDRVIELEYTGHGLKDYRLVVPVDATEFDVDDPYGLGAGLEAGTETLEGDPDSDELDAFLSGEGAVSFDSEFADDDEIPEAESDRDNPEMGVREEDDFGGLEGPGEDGSEGGLDPGEGEGPEAMQAAGGAHPDDEQFDEGMDPHNPVGEGLAGKVEDPDAPPQKGVKLVAFESRPLEQATVRRLSDAERKALDAQTSYDEALKAGWKEVQEGEETDVDQPEESWPDQDEWPDESVAGAFTYGDWILHNREQQRADGSWHHVYFFAKGRSPNGTPAPMPEGYEVGINARTQLPYLRRQKEQAGPTEPTGANAPEPEAKSEASTESPKRRVRMRRVTAESAQEAEEAVRREGRKVLGTMPVDIREHEEDDSR